MFLFFTVTAFAQVPKPASELVAEGKAKIKVKPDVVTLKIEVRKRNDSEAVALKALNTETAALQKFLIKYGVPQKAIKIADYSINSTNRYGSSTDDKQVYIASASLVVEMQLDNKLLDMVYTELQSGNYHDVTVNYTTSLSEALQKSTAATLIELAIADARANADNMAKALGVKISGVKSVSKTGTDAFFYKGRVDKFVSRSPRYMDGGILSESELTDKEIDDEITIVYEIEK